VTAIINPILKHLESGNISFVLVLALIAVFFNFRKISIFLEERKRTKIEKMVEALKYQQFPATPETQQ